MQTLTSQTAEFKARLEAANAEAAVALAEFRSAAEARRKLYAEFAASLQRTV